MTAVSAGRAGGTVAAGLVVAALGGCMTTRQDEARAASTQPVAVAPAAATQPAEAGLTREERIRGLLTVYATARQHFAYFGNVPDVDWDKAFVAALSEVEPEQSLADYYLALERYIQLLGDGHTGVSFPRRSSGSSTTCR